MINKYYILIIISLIILFLIPKNDIIISKNTGQKYILDDNDNYFKSFTKEDLKVRHILNIDEYKKIGMRSIVDGEYKDVKILQKACKIADNKLKCIRENWFDYNKCINIPWKFCLYVGNDYEEGLPHTREDVIFINKRYVKMNKTLIQTIIHEKIHIYQKKYPKCLDIYLNERRIQKYKLRKGTDKIRANPDVDDWVYKDSKGQEMKAIYNKNANKISDVTYYPTKSQYSEHPLEQMAIHVERKTRQC